MITRNWPVYDRALMMSFLEASIISRALDTQYVILMNGRLKPANDVTSPWAGRSGFDSQYIQGILSSPPLRDPCPTDTRQQFSGG